MKTYLNLFFSLTLWGLCSSESLGDDRRPNKGSLKIMTFNTYFMWDGEEPEEGQVKFRHRGQLNATEKHMKSIATEIKRNNADIVQLTEIENFNALHKLNQKYLKGYGYAPYFVKGGDSYTGQDVGLLTRVDPENGEIERDKQSGRSGAISKTVSKNFYAKFSINDLKIGLIGLHFLARPNAKDRLHRRQAQADAIRKRAQKLTEEGYHPIILGDFNDYDGDKDSRDHLNSMPITDVISRIKNVNPSDPDDNLFNVCSLVPKHYRYTAFWDQNDDNEINYAQELTSIDHILIPELLRERVASAYIPHNYDPRKSTDHFPVIVRLNVAQSDESTIPPHEFTTSTNGSRHSLLKGKLDSPQGTSETTELLEQIGILRKEVKTLRNRIKQLEQARNNQ